MSNRNQWQLFLTLAIRVVRIRPNTTTRSVLRPSTASSGSRRFFIRFWLRIPMPQFFSKMGRRGWRQTRTIQLPSCRQWRRHVCIARSFSQKRASISDKTITDGTNTTSTTFTSETCPMSLVLREQLLLEKLTEKRQAGVSGIALLVKIEFPHLNPHWRERDGAMCFERIWVSVSALSFLWEVV